MLIVEIVSLEAGLHHVEFRPAAEDLGLEPSKFNDIRVDIRMDVQDRRILVVLEARSMATLICDRTLRPFDQEIGGSFTVLFEEGATSMDKEQEFDEIRAFHPEDSQIDLTDVVRDTLLLSVPQRCVAPGAEEEEIPTEFGAPEDDVDPRWDALRKLRSADDFD